MSPKEILLNTGSWAHWWKWSPGNRGASSAQGSTDIVDNSRHLQSQLDQMKEKLKLIQSTKDKAYHDGVQDGKRRQENNDGGNGSKYAKGDGKNKGGKNKGGKGKGGKGKNRWG